MICIDGYSSNGDLIVLRDVETGDSEGVLPATLHRMFSNGARLVFKSKAGSSKPFEGIFEFASNLFESKGFSASMLDFNNTVLLLVSVSQYKDFGQTRFLSNFTYSPWSTDMYSIALGEFSNLMRVVDLGIRREKYAI